MCVRAGSTSSFPFTSFFFPFLSERDASGPVLVFRFSFISLFFSCCVGCVELSWKCVSWKGKLCVDDRVGFFCIYNTSVDVIVDGWKEKRRHERAQRAGSYCAEREGKSVCCSGVVVV